MSTPLTKKQMHTAIRVFIKRARDEDNVVNNSSVNLDRSLDAKAKKKLEKKIQAAGERAQKLWEIADLLGNAVDAGSYAPASTSTDPDSWVIRYLERSPRALSRAISRIKESIGMISSSAAAAASSAASSTASASTSASTPSASGSTSMTSASGLAYVSN